MRALSGKKEPEEVADAIIWQPAVRQMLLTQKAVAEGGRSMVYECALRNPAQTLRNPACRAPLTRASTPPRCALLADKMNDAKAAGDEKGEKVIDEQLAFLTPILKGFLTEMGKEAADLAVQAYGGHGYIVDNRAEQNLRDVRIAALWEGTTQIQALDLLGRKIMLQKMKPIGEHCGRLYAQCRPLLMHSDSGLRRRAWSLLGHAADWQLLTYRLGLRAASDREAIAAASVDYLMLSGYVTLAAHWLRIEETAVRALASRIPSPTPLGLLDRGDADGFEEEAEFYRAKVQTSAFVFERLLPRTAAHRAAILAPTSALTAMRNEDFSFDYAR